jgi:hypothetical protein
MRLLPGRTVTAIRKRISQERRRQGLIREARGRLQNEQGPTMLDPDDEGLSSDYPARWAQNAARANAAFLQALGIAA